MTTWTDPDPLVPPPTAQHVQEPGGELYIWQPCRGVVVETISGAVTLAFARALGEFYAPLVAAGARFRMFVDLSAVRSYTREAREYLVTSTLERGPCVEAIHFLIASKDLALGVAAFQLAVGDLPVHTYFDRASFLQSYEAAVQDLAAAPLPAPLPAPLH